MQGANLNLKCLCICLKTEENQENVRHVGQVSRPSGYILATRQLCGLQEPSCRPLIFACLIYHVFINVSNTWADTTTPLDSGLTDPDFETNGTRSGLPLRLAPGLSLYYPRLKQGQSANLWKKVLNNLTAYFNEYLNVLLMSPQRTCSQHLYLNLNYITTPNNAFTPLIPSPSLFYNQKYYACKQFCVHVLFHWPS